MLRARITGPAPLPNVLAVRFPSGVAAALVALVVGAGSAPAAEPTLDSACPGPVEPATAAAVIEARALRLADGRVLQLAGIEPPGLIGGDDAVALNRLRALAGGADIAVRIVGEADRYGRLPALVTAGGVMLQESLLRDGLAVAVTAETALPCFASFLAAEAEARAAHAGLWASKAILAAADPDLLLPHVGQFVIVEGIVRSVGNRRSTTYLNFGFRWSADFTVAISADDREAFGGEAALASLEGRRIRVRGVLEAAGGPLIRLTTPLMLEGAQHTADKPPATPRSVAPAP